MGRRLMVGLMITGLALVACGGGEDSAGPDQDRTEPESAAIDSLIETRFTLLATGDAAT